MTVLRVRGHSGGNETKWNCSQWNPHACTHMQHQLKFKTTRLHAAHRAIPTCVCSLLQLCKHKCQSLCKRANKMALSVYSLLIVLQQCTKTPLQATLMTREDVSWLVTVGHRPQTLDDNISSETFSAENTHLFSMHLFGGRLHYIHLQIAARQLQGLCVKEKHFKCKSTQASGTPWGREIESCLERYSLPGHNGLGSSSLLIYERINVRTLFLKFWT